MEDEGGGTKDDQPTDEEAEEQKEPTPPQANQPSPVTWDSLGEQRKFFNFDIMPKVNKYVYIHVHTWTHTHTHTHIQYYHTKVFILFISYCWQEDQWLTS